MASDAIGEALAERGKAAIKVGDYEAAAAAFAAALTAEPGPEEPHKVHEMLAQVLMQLDRDAEALSEAEKAAQMSPHWAPAQLTLGRAARNCGQLRAALQAFHASLALDSEDMSVKEELLEAERLLEHQVAREVGLPQLAVMQRTMSGAGLGGVVWEGGSLLARYLVSQLPQGWLMGKAVLELGSGTGVVGLAAALLGAQVTLTDLPEVLPLLLSNAERNAAAVGAAGGTATAAVLDWAAPDATLLERRWDVLIGADLVYSQDAVQLLAGVVKALLVRSPNADVLIAHKARHEDVDWLLLGTLRDVGLHLQGVAVGGEGDRVTLYRRRASNT